MALTAVNLGGITRTARLTRVLLVVTSLALTVVVVAAVSGPGAPTEPLTAPDVLGVLQGAGLLFFAFAGYARVATLGEEVRDPDGRSRAPSPPPWPPPSWSTPSSARPR